MSIQSEITRINTNIANAYDAVDTMGGTVPQTQNTANLPDAIATLAQTDYIQLVWIEGTGCQYIDTGITPNDNYIIEMTASNHSNDDTAFFGANDTWNSNRLLCYAIYSRVYFRGSGSSYISHDVTSSTPYIIRVSSSSFTVNGANNQPQTTLGAINTTLKFFSGGSRIGKFRFYSAKVWNGNTLVGDYIPVLKISTYDVGVYNKVDNTFINNSGLGYFRPGIKIEGYSILDYLQSSGAAWFDTGVSGGSKMEYSMAINTLGSKARNYEQYFAGDLSPVSHKLYLETYNNRNAILARGSSGSVTLYTNADAWHTISFYSDGKLYLDTTLKGTLANNGWGTLSYYLFNSHSEPTLISSMRMRYLVMKTDGVLQRFYIPMQKESSHTLGVYDLINDTFVSSASNTAFTANQRLIIDDGTSSPDYPQIIVPTPSTKSGSIADQIDRINENIANAYDVCRQIGRTMPPIENSFYLEPTILEQRFQTFTVTFENYDGTVLQTIQCYYGQTPVYSGSTPTKPSDYMYDYTFSGWNNLMPVTGNTTYTAQYTSSLRNYTVVWKNYDNSTLLTSTYHYGDLPTYTGQTPTKPYDGYTYTFDSWLPTITTVTGDTSYVAQYTSSVIASTSMYYKIANSTLYLRNSNASGYTNCSNILNTHGESDVPWANNHSITSVVIEEPLVPIRMNHWFAGLENVTNFSNLSRIKTDLTTSMAYLFYLCSDVTSLNIDHFVTNSVRAMDHMFAGCNSLASINVSNFDTSNVIDMQLMFAACESLTTLNVSNFNTSKVRNMEQMFDGCSGLTSLDLSSFDTRNVERFTWMFEYMTSLRYLDLSSFNTDKEYYSYSPNRLHNGMFTGTSWVPTAYARNNEEKNRLDDAVWTSTVPGGGFTWRFTVKS